MPSGGGSPHALFTTKADRLKGGHDGGFMIRLKFHGIVSGALALCLGAGAIALAADDTTSPHYAVAKTLKVGGDGGWDYVTVSPNGKLLYAPRSTHTQVIDTETGKVVGDIPGQGRSHGVAVVPDAGRGFITDGKAPGGDGAVIIFDLKSNEPLGKLKTPADSDGILYDDASGKVLVVSGDGGVLVPIKPDVDPKSGQPEPAVDLGAAPEFFATDGQGKAFINLADKNQIAVLDTRTMKVIDHWSTAPGGGPTGMAIDREKGVLFIGCRKPQKMIVMSTKDGKVLADLPIGPGVDATKFDRGNAFASCADGTLAVVRETSPGKYEVAQTVQTAPGARTMDVDRNTGTIYLAAADMQPQSPGQKGRPKPIAGTFKIIVVSPQPAPGKG